MSMMLDEEDYSLPMRPGSQRRQRRWQARLAKRSHHMASSPVSAPPCHRPRSGIAKDVDLEQRVDIPLLETPVHLTVPTPVFALSLPKSGTTTLFRYFQCGLGKRQAMHQYSRLAKNKVVRMPMSMEDNLAANRSLMEGCGNYTVYTDFGGEWPIGDRQRACYFPSVHGLAHLAEAYPSATTVLVKRNTSHWVTSASTWNNLLSRMSDHCDGFPPQGSTLEEWGQWYESHNEKVNMFCPTAAGMAIF